MKKRKPQSHVPRTPKRLKIMGQKRGSKRPIPRNLVIDASRESDERMLPVRINGGALAKNSLLTVDRVAEDVGGRDELVNMCRLSDAPEAIEFVRKCETDGNVSLDNILASMNTKFSEILKSVVPALCEYGGQVSKLINALKSPEMMKASIKVAVEDGAFGFPDRKMQLEIAGIVERQKGMTVIGQMNAGGGIERPEATYSGTATRVDDGGDE